MRFEPKSLPQKAALSCGADIMLFGGAAGSLKSFTLLIDAAQDIDNPNHNAILFRRTYPELEAALIKQSREIYPGWGGVYNESKRQWTFPSGAQIAFGHCQRDSDIYNYMGAEYTYIGFDESTHFNEFPIRYMLSRLRSKDPTIKLKMRLASNPGSEGGVWHMKIFQGSTCIHCQPTLESREPFVIYNDAVWPSDGEPIGLTTCFIPGRVDDHSIFGIGGIRYVDKLKSLPENYRKALLEGCWALFEGQFFRCWNAKTMIVPSNCLYRQDENGEIYEPWEKQGRPVQAQSWWPRWVSLDWGFAHASAAYLFTKAPNGVTYVLGEYITNRTKPETLAMQIKQMWYEREEVNPIVASYLSPDAWAKRDDDSCIADQMSEMSQIYFTKASNDRIGGAMMIYTMLETGKLKITSACPQLISSIPSRIHDDSSDGKRQEDVKKTGDVLDDVYDSFRYGVYSHQGAPIKPRFMLIEEAITSKDPTIAMMQRRIVEERFNREDQPITYGRGSYRQERGGLN